MGCISMPNGINDITSIVDISKWWISKLLADNSILKKALSTSQTYSNWNSPNTPPVHPGNTSALIPTLLSPYFSSDTCVGSSNRLQKIEKWWPHAWVELRDLKHSADLSLLTRPSEQTEHSTKRVSWIKVCQVTWWLCTYNHKGEGWSQMVQRWSTYKTQ